MALGAEKFSIRHQAIQCSCITGILLLVFVSTGYAVDDIKEDSARRAQNTKKEQLQYSQEQRDDLSCSKQARRLHKLADKEKRRQFIADCRMEREVRQRAELEKKAGEEQKKREAAKAVQRGDL